MVLLAVIILMIPLNSEVKLFVNQKIIYNQKAINFNDIRILQ